MEYKNNFTEILNDLYTQTNLTRSKFANLVGIKHSQVTKYLQGTIPTTATVVKICDYFGCAIDYIIGITKQYSYENMKSGFDCKAFYPEYENILHKNSTNHFALSKRGVVCETRLSTWKKGGLPKFEVLIDLAYEFGASIDKMLGRI